MHIRGLVASGVYGNVYGTDSGVVVKQVRYKQGGVRMQPPCTRELDALHELRHHNVISCLGVHVGNEHIYIAMPHLPYDLSALLQHGPLALEETRSLVLQLLRGMRSPTWGDKAHVCSHARAPFCSVTTLPLAALHASRCETCKHIGAKMWSPQADRLW